MSAVAESRKVVKTFKYKLKPSTAQIEQMETVLALCCELYNAALEERRTAWRRCGVTVRYLDQQAQLPEIKRVRSELMHVYSQVLVEPLRRVDFAFRRFYQRVRQGETPGYPRFKSPRRYRSFTYSQFGYRWGAQIKDDALWLAKIGRIAVRWSRPLEGTVKQVTVSKEPDGWYASFICVDVPVSPLPLTHCETGIDLGIETFATLADGTRIHNPRCMEKAQRGIRVAERRVSRRKKFSHRWRKGVAQLSKAHQKVKRQRADFHHKTARALVHQYDTIYHEDLRIASLVKNSRLTSHIKDAGWGRFLIILAYKAAWAGKRVEAVNPRNTSQTCSGCGVIVTKGLSVRWHACPECGASLHRDHNAALNILQSGRTVPSGANVSR